MKLLSFATQKYEWGKKGKSSVVGQLAAAADPNAEINEDEPYAELWMGTHPNGPSRIAKTGQSLEEFIRENESWLGKDLISRFGVQLPFLFKVLSVAKALSIQAHPNKKHAEELHKNRPDLYKDPNHKPELAIALGEFEALCGFRPLAEIKEFIKIVPELRNIIGDKEANELENCKPEDEENALRECFTSFMSKDDVEVKNNLKSLLSRLSNADPTVREKQLADLIERLEKQFPDDIGCFSVYFLNKLKLESGQSLYLGPNEPHAYLSGNCIECMACSDNVVRAGLTPKYKDVPTLCSMLTYETGPAEAKLFQPIIEDSHCSVYTPPVQDFAVARICLAEGEYRMNPRNSASILLVVEGDGEAIECSSNLVSPQKLTPGLCYFIGEGSKDLIKHKGDKPLIMFQAFANI